MSLTLNEYQSLAEDTAIYAPSVGLHYTIMGLASEAGEVSGKAAKALLKEVPIDRDATAKELGDCLWYLALAAKELGYTLEQIAHMNIDKLYSRKERGVLKGDGDDR